MSSTARSLSAILAVAILSPLATAQEICTLEIRTATVTECFPNTGATVTPSCKASCPTPVASAKPNGPIFVEVQAPRCDSCGCDTCVHTNVYTTTYDVFCATGIAQQEYVVTEIYSGMSGVPTMPSATRLPFGFTAGVDICTECGKTPITATLTYPDSGCPYILGMSEPTGAPEGVSAYEVCTTGTGATGAVQTAPITGPSKSGPGSGSPPNSGSGPSDSGPGSSPASGSSLGSSDSSSGSNAGYSMPGETASAEPPASTDASGFPETSGGHPTFMAVTLGGVLGFFISFLAFAL